jgi:hypothetical protein
MAGPNNRIWVVCLKSKREPVRIDAARVTQANGQYTFTDDSDTVVGIYDISSVEGYSAEPIGTANMPGITVIVDGAPSE